MNHLVRPWRRRVARVLALALALGSAPVCLAGEPPGPQSSPSPLAASIDKAVQHELGQPSKVSASNARIARQESANGPASGTSFLRSKAGMVTIVLLAAGTGFALYSTSHDRIKSPKVTYGGTWK